MGSLAPYRVRRVVLSPDAEGWSPEPGQRDRFGAEIPEGIYSTRDFERTVALLARTRLAATHLSVTLRANPDARTIVFCADVEHADQMRAALVAENPDLLAADPEWVVRIVGVENEKARLLEAFTDPESASPVVATTSRLLSTGIDVEDLRYVVLFRMVGSQVEFKQIIGRGTRLYPDKRKTFFEIIDYVGATQHFQDPDFDGYPEHISHETIDGDGAIVDNEVVDPYDAGNAAVDPLVDPVLHEPEPDFESGGSSDDQSADEPLDGQRRRKLFVDDGDFTVLAEGRLVPDTRDGHLRLTEYGEFVAGEVRTLCVSHDELARRWSETSARDELRATLARHGVDVAELAAGRGMEAADPFDVLVAVAWNSPVITRAERARRVRATHQPELEAQTDIARQVLAALLDRYVEHGVDDLSSAEALRLPPIASLGSMHDIAEAFGGSAMFHQQVAQLQRWLYSA